MSSQRNGVITLIPKKDRDSYYLKNYKPISLLTVDYKSLAKTIIANRLKKSLSYLIHSDQSRVLKGRNIGNNDRLITDMIEYTKANNIPGAILLDIQKAFDSVSHKLLLCVLKKFNFIAINVLIGLKFFIQKEKVI